MYHGKRLNGLDDKLSSEEVVLNYTPKEKSVAFPWKCLSKPQNIIICVCVLVYKLCIMCF